MINSPNTDPRPAADVNPPIPPGTWLGTRMVQAALNTDIHLIGNVDTGTALGQLAALVRAAAWDLDAADRQLTEEAARLRAALAPITAHDFDARHKAMMIHLRPNGDAAALAAGYARLEVLRPPAQGLPHRHPR